MADEEKQEERSNEEAEPSEEAVGETPIEEESLEELLAKKNEELKELQDRLLRMAAENENTRKRLEREKSDGICFANENLIRELLPVIDNLERAVQHGENDSDLEGLLEGVRMTLKAFAETLSKFGCNSFESVGKPFDPNYHEAVMQQENEEYPENTVLQEFRKGYTLNDRLLRAAMVVVSKASSSS
ncbi:nucleotide exchange factor GrpE [Desulforhabdus amnigena]|jgi:molecular chaperone GrpE|uniref:Protein GrpE n=1 Tax=Desulforhabdus amnigena TaxID=40218 RepID=A0A9W6LAX6_9BACT|nr:nucleotide exchange factor GrpE [Desulforhabdus amnigena]NLJ29469.1 nucleotide exchange factor GrpE [Deltaproteobacteria bacterium]GLI36151.1 hypothetical protein DAMNIGENAA_35840 [Desulforhabdus amnigena]